MPVSLSIRSLTPLCTEQVETLLKDPGLTAATPDGSRICLSMSTVCRHKQNQRPATTANFNVTDPSIGIANSRDVDRWHFNGEFPRQDGGSAPISTATCLWAYPMSIAPSPGEMIGLGLRSRSRPTKPLTSCMLLLLLLQAKLPEDCCTVRQREGCSHQIFFEKIHPSRPQMIHKYRSSLAAMNL